MTTKISQREARRLARRVRELETLALARNETWRSDWPGGKQVASRWQAGGKQVAYTSASAELVAVVRTARRLGHAVVVVDDGGALRYYGVLP